jgi:hypothetical protein
MQAPQHSEDPLAKMLHERWRGYASARSEWEAIWTENWTRFKNEWKPEIDKTEGSGGRSKAVYGLGRRKVKIFVAHVHDLLFGQGKLPFELTNTPIPDYAIRRADGSIDQQSFDMLEDQERVEGMEKAITDQLIEGKFKNEVHNALLHMGIFGSGAIEGPIVEMRKRVEYQPIPIDETNLVRDENGQVDPTSITANMRFERRSFEVPSPIYVFRDIWDIYPDLTREDPQKGEGIFTIDELSEAELSALSLTMDSDGQSKFDSKKILYILNGSSKTDNSDVQRGPHRERLRNQQQYDGHRDERVFHVFTYHGRVTESDLTGYDATGRIDSGDKKMSYYLPKEVIVTFCNGLVLRKEDNTNPKMHRQIKIAPTIKLPGSPFGWGILWEMAEPERIFNAFLRLFVDNKRKAAYLDMVKDRDRLENPDEPPGYDREWITQSGAGIDKVVSYIPYPDVSQNCMEILQFCEEWGNSASNIPAFMEGDQVQSGSNTAYEVSEQKSSAMKMLGLTMQSIDANLLEPSFEDLYHWNMDYAQDETIKGDYEVHVKGADNFRDNVVVAAEMQRILALAGTNEAMNAEINYRKAIKRMSKSSHVGIEEILKTDKEKAEESQQAAKAQQQAQQQAMQAMREQLQLQTDAKMQEIQAKNQGELEKLKAKFEADMQLLIKKVDSAEDVALLKEEGNRMYMEQDRQMQELGMVNENQRKDREDELTQVMEDKKFQRDLHLKAMDAKNKPKPKPKAGAKK